MYILPIILYAYVDIAYTYITNYTICIHAYCQLYYMYVNMLSVCLSDSLTSVHDVLHREQLHTSGTSGSSFP